MKRAFTISNLLNAVFAGVALYFLRRHLYDVYDMGPAIAFGIWMFCITPIWEWYFGTGKKKP